MRLLFQSFSADPARWRAALQALEPGLEFRIWPDVGDPAQIDVMLMLRPPPEGLAAYTKLKLLHLISAGSDQLKEYPLPADLPAARLIAPGQVQGMVEYCMHAVLHHHRGFDTYARQQTQRVWREYPRVPASARKVAVLGLGALGGPVAQALRGVGFQMLGWSPSGRPVEGVEVHGGAAGLTHVLAEAEIVLALLPLSPETTGLFNATFFAAMRQGAAFINVGRGAQLDMPALAVALENGHLGGATLDVLPTEPPAQDDPVWLIPNLRLTPHVATSSDPITGAEVVIGNYRRVLRGEAPINAVWPQPPR